LNLAAPKSLATGFASEIQALMGPGSHFHEIGIVADENESDDKRVSAARRLLKTDYRYPIARKRWFAHRMRLQEAIREWAQDLQTSSAQAFNDATLQALFTVCAELKVRRASRTCLVIDKRRVFVDDLNASEELGLSSLRGYIRNRLSDELMDILVPDWREFNTREQVENTPHFLSLDSVDVDRPEDPWRSREQKSSVRNLLSDSRLSKDQRPLMRLMVEEDLNATAAGLQIGKGESWGRVNISRIREKLKKSREGVTVRR
jgi:hypothetical protein